MEAGERIRDLKRDGLLPVEWAIAGGPISYPAAVAAMEERAGAIRAGSAPERVWLVEHPPLYTAGTSAKPADLLAPDRFPVFQSGRGGEYTYHGPGQRVAYVMLDLNRRRPDVRLFVRSLEAWIIRTLAAFGIHGERRPEIGVWVETSGGDAKIAAIGIRIRRWVTFHGIALNVDPDLEHFAGIVPCGIRGYGVTSLKSLGVTATIAEVDEILRSAFEAVFGPTIPSAAR